MEPELRPEGESESGEGRGLQTIPGEGAAQRMGRFKVRKSLALGGLERRSKWLEGRVGERRGLGGSLRQPWPEGAFLFF